jgi:hypothetical protein
MEITPKDLLTFLEQFTRIVDEAAKKQTTLPPVERYRSDDITELAKSLSKCQGEFTTVKFNRQAKYFGTEYADLTAIKEMADPILSKHNLSLFQGKELTSGSPVLHTVLLHDCGQWIESRERITPPNNDEKTLESHINHLRRIEIQDLLGIRIAGDPLDDDADEAMAQLRQAYGQEPVTNTTKKRTDPYELVSQEQFEILEAEFIGYEKLLEEFLRAYNIRYLQDMPKIKFKTAVERLKSIKENSKR